MELREMRSFCAAARLRSISKAGNYLGVGQPAVTNHIKRLEEELGTPLFDRIKRPIQLTPVGATFYQQAASLVEEIDQLVSSVSKAEDEGPVRLASTNGIISHTLLGPVDSFLSRYPKVHLRIQSRTKREVLQMVKEGEVDFGIVPGLQRDTDFNFQELFPYERVLLVPINHPLLEVNPISLDQIAQWPLILMGRGTATRTLLEEQFQRRGLSYETVMEIDGMDMVKRYVTTGLGVAIGPRLAVDEGDEYKLGIINLSTILPVEQTGILTLKGKTISRPVQNFISVLRESLAAVGSNSKR